MSRIAMGFELEDAVVSRERRACRFQRRQRKAVHYITPRFASYSENRVS